MLEGMPSWSGGMTADQGQGNVGGVMLLSLLIGVVSGGLAVGSMFGQMESELLMSPAIELSETAESTKPTKRLSLPWPIRDG